MLRFDLSLLDREGSAAVEAEVPPDDPMWEGIEFAFEVPVSVQLRAVSAGSGELVVRGSFRGQMRRECRRCLIPVAEVVDKALTMVFVSSATAGAEEDGEVRVFDPDDAILDVKDAVREEVVLAIDRFVVCDPECKGLCPTCGVNLNEESCGCVRVEADPRWDVLRTLKEE